MPRGIYELDMEKKENPGAIPIDRIQIAVRDMEKAEPFYDRLMVIPGYDPQHKTSAVIEEHGPNYYAMFFKDPDGIKHEIAHNKLTEHTMFDARQWAATLTEKLRNAFGERLLFTGLQGSYRRGEAGANSDVDLVVIIDGMTMEDLKTYRTILLVMPDNGKACGFVGGRAELAAWPRHEIFQFGRDTEALYGRLDGLLPEVRRGDVEESVRIGASGLYHMLCHTYLHGDEAALREAVIGACKGAFFILQAVRYLRSGFYADSKKTLLPLLAGDERRILEIGMGAEAMTTEDVWMLISWCSTLLDEYRA